MSKRRKLVRHANRKKRHKRGDYSPRPNPPLFMELVEFAGPGFGGFVVSRFVTRAASTVVSRKWPKLGKHAGVLASVATFVGAWYGANRIKQLQKYHTPIVVGSLIAAGQTILQTYFPRLAWIVSDANAELEANGDQKQISDESVGDDENYAEDDDFEPIEDSGWFSYNDARSGGRYDKNPQRQTGPATAEPEEQGTSDEDSELWGMLEDDDEMQGAGIFNN